MVGRRGFLRGLLGATATLALDPEKLLWVPGKKLISIPPLGVSESLPLLDEISAATLKFINFKAISDNFYLGGPWQKMMNEYNGGDSIRGAIIYKLGRK